MIKLDQEINIYVEKYLLPLCKHIHPNLITIFGLLLNIIAIHFYYIKKNKDITAILLIIRILMDNLDGMVARKFNKTSKLGGLLDGLSDCVLMGTISFGVLDKMGVNIHYKICLSLQVGCMMFGYLIYSDAVTTHSNMNNNNSILDTIPLFIYHNTYLGIFLVILAMYLF